jgi:hypothetical protein
MSSQENSRLLLRQYPMLWHLLLLFPNLGIIGHWVRDFQIKKYSTTYCGVGISPTLVYAKALKIKGYSDLKLVILLPK